MKELIANSETDQIATDPSKKLFQRYVCVFASVHDCSRQDASFFVSKLGMHFLVNLLADLT